MIYVVSIMFAILIGIVIVNERNSSKKTKENFKKLKTFEFWINANIHEEYKTKTHWVRLLRKELTPQLVGHAIESYLFYHAVNNKIDLTQTREVEIPIEWKLCQWDICYRHSDYIMRVTFK